MRDCRKSRQPADLDRTIFAPGPAWADPGRTLNAGMQNPITQSSGTLVSSALPLTEVLVVADCWQTEPDAEAVIHRAIEADERLAYLEARGGKTFGDICTLLEFQNADEKIIERVASFLADWFRDGLVCRVSVRA